MIVLPIFDLPTQSSSGFIIRYILPRTLPPQLVAFLARRRPFELFAQNGDFLLGVGHGDEDTYTGQNESVILDAGKYNPKEVNGKVVKLLSCLTAQQLGPDIIANGAACYMGYKDDYVWVMDADLASTPWSDKMAAESLMPVIDGLNALLDGATCGEAFQIELDGYSRNAEGEENELIKACLEFNRDNAVLLGDPNARVRARPKITLPLPPPPLLPISLMPFALLSILTGPLPP